MFIASDERVLQEMNTLALKTTVLGAGDERVENIHSNFSHTYIIV